MLLAQLSDPHIGASPSTETDLAAAVRAVTAVRPAPDAVLVSGDLAEHATAAEYARVRELLAPLAMPVHVLPGNHDDRAALRAAFPLEGDAAAPYRYAVRCGALRLVACDSHIPGAAAGALDMDWLAAELAADPVTPTIVAMHHPPFAVGMPASDAIRLAPADARALEALLADASQVARVVAGHVHLAAMDALGGCPVMTCPSTWRERPVLDLESEEWVLHDAPAGFALHVLLDGRVISHVHPI